LKKLIILFIVTLLFFQSITYVSAQEIYDSSVFNPNGATYVLDGLIQVTIVNESNNELLMQFNASIDAKLKLLSERLNLDFVKWSGILNFSYNTYSYYYNETPEEDYRNMSIPIPPLFFIKENTREAYFANISLEELQGENMEDAMKKMMQKISAGEINENFYVYNIFYIPKNVDIGSKITYGFWNVTANKGLELAATVVSSSTLEVAEESYDVWVVELDYHNLTELFQEVYDQLGFNVTEQIFKDAKPEEIKTIKQVIESIYFTLKGYYEKASGWLVKGVADVDASGTTTAPGDINATFPVSYQVTVDMVANLIDPGSVRLGGRSTLARMFDVDDTTLLSLDIVFVALVVVYLALKKRKG